MSLKEKVSWTKSPLIINAPLGGYAGGSLATAVTEAGGLGFVGSGGDIEYLKTQLQYASASLKRQLNGLLPIGVGLLNFLEDVDATMSILKQYRPAIIWFFAAKQLEDYSTWTKQVRAALPKDTQVWIQVGSVGGAVQVAEECRPDVLCIQGSDAGGHGLEKGAGIISLLPEVRDALAVKGFSHIPLVAAGGIADYRGAAAAFTLGAQGVVLGTRFLAATETHVHPEYRKAILATSDGGQSTVRAKLFDNLRGPNLWPTEYNGRSIVVESFVEFEKGVRIEDIREKYKEAVKEEDNGFAIDGKGRAAMWAGTGVGLVGKEQSAREIVEEVRRGVVKAFEELKSKF